MGDIACNVEECQYNNRKRCHAGGIQVRSSGDRKVATSDGTACETFRPRS